MTLYQEIKRASYTNFFRVLLDENLSWKKYLKYTENKTRLFYKAKSFLDKDSLLSLYFSYIRLYINYANLAWAIPYKTNLKNICSQQKHVFRIVYNTIQRNYKMNLLNTSIFMHKIKTGSDPAAFHTTFKVTFYWSLKRFTSLNYSKPKTRLRLGYDFGSIRTFCN